MSSPQSSAPPVRMLLRIVVMTAAPARPARRCRALKKADTSGWTVVSMKDDFATVFAAADREDATAARPAVKAVVSC